MKNLTRLLSTVLLALIIGACNPPQAIATTDEPEVTSPVDSAVLHPGEGVRSPDGRFLLTHQRDGNVVLYGPSGGIWQTRTAGRASSHLAMQPDGNLVLYDAAGAPLWHTATHGKGEQLAVQDDANVVVYAPDKPVWAIKGMTPPPVPVPYQLRKIGWCEAGKYIGLPRYQTHYQAYNQQGSSASGGYQILDGTWRVWRTYVVTDPPATSFARAAHAPPHVQDAVATAAYHRHGTQPWNASAGCWRYE